MSGDGEYFSSGSNLSDAIEALGSKQMTPVSVFTPVGNQNQFSASRPLPLYTHPVKVGFVCFLKLRHPAFAMRFGFGG